MHYRAHLRSLTVKSNLPCVTLSSLYACSCSSHRSQCCSFSGFSSCFDECNIVLCPQSSVIWPRGGTLRESAAFKGATRAGNMLGISGHHEAAHALEGARGFNARSPNFLPRLKKQTGGRMTASLRRIRASVNIFVI